MITRRGVIQILATAVGVATLDLPRVAIAPADELPDSRSDGAEGASCVTRSTPLDRYLRSRGIKPSVLARESGYSRQFLLRLRTGRMRPTLHCAATIVATLRRITREPVRAREVFGVTL